MRYYVSPFGGQSLWKKFLKNERNRQKNRNLRNRLQFYIWNPFKKIRTKKKFTKKIEITSKFKWKILYKLIGPRKKNYKRIPFKFDLGFILQGNPFTFLRLLDWFLKNPTKRVFLNFLIRTPNLSKILNPQEICRDNFFIYI